MPLKVHRVGMIRPLKAVLVMAINKADIRVLVKRRLGLAIENETHDDLIGLYIDAVEEGIRNFIHDREVPDGLKQTWAAMAASALFTEQLAVLFPPPDPVEAFETQIGDTTVKPIKPVINTAPPGPSLAAIESVMFDYKSSLIAYRKMRW
ncbi:phage head-tail connector protein [Paenibacillus flagellatus]|uniref:phage head-tail connector protein n=1 Tax=Paenibacillus flagellatus TaxID=2211139 RepID=UPI00130509B0|nr:phage head-tail connector protein [Paenibacillus flagellatus]